MEFYKARVEELREDNAILVETKNMLEDQLGASQKRVESVVDLENELIKYRQQVDELTRVSFMKPFSALGVGVLNIFCVQ